MIPRAPQRMRLLILHLFQLAPEDLPLSGRDHCLELPHLVAVDDGIEAVSHHDYRLALERRPHHVLNEGVRMLVNVGGSLVHDQDLRPLEHRPSEAKQLPLPNLMNAAEYRKTFNRRIHAR